MMPQPIDYHWLMSHAANPEDWVARAFAGVIDHASRERLQAPNLAMGLSQARFAELLDRYFPGVRAALYGASCKTPCDECVSLQAEEFDDLVQLLLDHRADDSEQTEWLAYAIASGCMGENHLFEDMGLPNRLALSDLLNRHFTALFVKNIGNMKWKKFFYKQLCDRAQVHVCKAPSCQVCADFDACFGPEDDSGLARIAAMNRRTPIAERDSVPDWLQDLPDEYHAQVASPRRYERFEEDSLQAHKILGYDQNGECCYHRHRYALTREVLDDEDNFYEEEAYFEDVKAWRLAGGVWLSRTIQAGQVGDCRDRSLRPGYAIVPDRPR